GALGMAQLVAADAQVLGQLVVLGRPGELLRQLGAGPAQLQPQLLGGALDVHVPPLVPEVPLDLARDAGLGVGGEVAAEGRVEVVDGLEQTDVADLHQLFWGLGAVPVALGARPDQRFVPADEFLARGVPLLAVPRQRLDQLHELRVSYIGAVRGGGVAAGQDGGHGRSPAAVLVLTGRSWPWCGLLTMAGAATPGRRGTNIVRGARRGRR